MATQTATSSLKAQKAPQTVIDTGQSLGKNVMIKNGKVVSSTADIVASPQPGMPSVFGDSSLVAQENSQVQTQKLVEPKTYYSAADGQIRVYRDTTGSYWLTVPLFLGILIPVGLLAFAVFFAVTKSAVQRKKERAKLRKVESVQVAEEVVEDFEVKTEAVEMSEIESTEIVEEIDQDLPAQLSEENDIVTEEKSEEVSEDLKPLPKFRKISL